ncbi:hypothetical protein D021_1600 [Vibrio parahaemolyticus 10296]|nr:hypothetical protein D021_1600 [Vibrio parahaemolyticus 10296]
MSVDKTTLAPALGDISILDGILSLTTTVTVLVSVYPPKPKTRQKNV